VASQLGAGAPQAVYFPLRIPAGFVIYPALRCRAGRFASWQPAFALVSLFSSPLPEIAISRRQLELEFQQGEIVIRASTVTLL
jgi:hypothetical protein